MASRITGGLIGLAALLMAGLLPSVASAATLYVTEFNSPVSQSGSSQAQNLGQPAITTQTVAITGASVSSSAFNAQTHGIQVYCDSGCSVAVGTSPTATTSSQVLTSNQPQTFTVAPGQKIAVIANTSGTPSGGGGGAVTIADGADVTQGAIANAAVAAGAAGTVNAHLRTISGQLPATVGQKAMAASLPVVIASDQSSFPVTVAAGSAVIGHVIADTGSTTAVTGNVTVVQPTGTNLHTVLDTTSTTAVTQATGTNLHAVLDATSTTAVTQATGTNLHTVVDSGTLTAVTAITNALPAGSNAIGHVVIDAGTAFAGFATPRVATLSTTITRPADSNAYAANDAFANSTTVPTAGGFTLTSACSASGGNGTILSANVSASASTAYQGEIWVFDQAVTATNDNAALSVSDSDILNLVGVIPFNTTDVNAANSISYTTGLDIGFTCIGTANLRFLVKIMAAVTPASAEVLAVRVQVQN